MRENTWDETISLGDFSLSEQFRFPKETKWLYPQNQAFADAKLVKKEAEVFHQKEVLHNFTKIDYDFLSLPWVIGYAVVGIIALLAAVYIVFWTISSFNDPDMMAKLNPFAPGNRFRDNWLFMPVIGLLGCLPLGMGMLNWAMNAYPYLKYPTSQERHYRQLLKTGRIKMARVENIETVDERMKRIKFSLKNGRAIGYYLTISPVANTLKKGDQVVLLTQGDYDILL
jgi:hypothetical protein